MIKNINKSSPSTMSVIALLLYTAAASSLLSVSLFGNVEITSSYIFSLSIVAMSIVGLLLCGALAGSIKPIIPFGIITFLIFAALGTPSVAGTIPLLIISVSLVAYICRILNSLFIIPIGIVAYVAAFFATHDAFLAAYSLTALPAAYFLYRAHNAGAQRVSAVCRISVAIGVFTLALTLVQIYVAEIYVAESTFDLYTLKTYFANIRAELVDNIASTLYATYNQILDGSMSMADATEMSSAAIGTVFNYLPAILIISLLVLSYVIHSLYIAVSVPITEDVSIIKNALAFQMSIHSAIIFLLALIASACLIYDGHDLAATAAQNVYAIFIPGLTLIFFGFVGVLARGARSCLGILIYLSLFGLLFYMPSIVFPLASIGGATVIIITTVKNKLDNKKNGQDKP